jgi:hypothetical protein
VYSSCGTSLSTWRDCRGACRHFIVNMTRLSWCLQALHCKHDELSWCLQPLHWDICSSPFLNPVLPHLGTNFSDVFTRLHLLLWDYLTMVWQALKYSYFGLPPLSKFIKTGYVSEICWSVLSNHGLSSATSGRTEVFLLFFVSCSPIDK